MTQYSKVFGPTDSAADTKTTVGSAAVLRPEAVTIKKIWVAKGNIVDAKECAGYITIETDTLEGPHHYAYGNGAGHTGGATGGGGTGPAEPIDCSIPIGANQKVTVSVKDAEVAKGVTVELDFDKGSGRNVYSYIVGGAGQDTAAATLLALTDNLTGLTPKILKAGTLKELRIAGSGVVDAKEGSGLLAIVPPVIKGPWEYAFGNGSGGDLGTNPAFADVRDVSIPVKEGWDVVFNVTTANIMLSPTISFQVV